MKQVQAELGTVDQRAGGASFIESWGWFGVGNMVTIMCSGRTIQGPCCGSVSGICTVLYIIALSGCLGVLYMQGLSGWGMVFFM